jgi:hypothetical protein
METLNVVVVHLFLNHYNFRMRKWIDPDNFALNQSIEWLSQNKWWISAYACYKSQIWVDPKKSSLLEVSKIMVWIGGIIPEIRWMDGSARIDGWLPEINGD